MNEHHEAEALADWLAGGAQPLGLDPLVVEAVLALRPELAPPHGVDVEDVLDSLLEGPLVNPAVAEALNHWLEAGPGTAPPSILPVGVVESAYALRPELAPAPSLTIDDILLGVSSGPLAESSEVGPTAELIELPSPWWRRRSVGLFAMAAIALIVVVPGAQQVMNQPTPFDGIEAVADAPQVRGVGFEARPESASVAREKSQPKVETAEEVAPQPVREAPLPKPVPEAVPKKVSASLDRAVAVRPSRVEEIDDAPLPPPAASLPPAPSPQAVVSAPPPAPASQERSAEPAEDRASNWSDEDEQSAPMVRAHGMYSVAEADEVAEVEVEPSSVRSLPAARKRSASLGWGGPRERRSDAAAQQDAEAIAPPSPSTLSATQAALRDAMSARAAGEYDSALAILTVMLESEPLSDSDRVSLLALKVEVLLALGRDKEAQQAQAALNELKEKR